MIVTGPRNKLADRCAERGTTLDAIRDCIVIEDDATITVDTDHPAYPRPLPAPLPASPWTPLQAIAAEPVADPYATLAAVYAFGAALPPQRAAQFAAMLTATPVDLLHLLQWVDDRRNEVARRLMGYTGLNR